MADRVTTASLPLVGETPRDVLRDGLGNEVFQLSVAAAARLPSAVTAAEAAPRRRVDERVQRVRATQGLGAAMRLASDVRRAEGFHRMPGFASSFLGRDVRAGDHLTLHVHDVYGDREDAVALQCDPLATLLSIAKRSS